MSQKKAKQKRGSKSNIALEPQQTLQIEELKKPESLAEEIMRTASPVEIDKIRLTQDDARKIASFVEAIIGEQFRSFNGESRSLFKFDKKTFVKQIEAFIQHKNGLASLESKATHAKELANNLAVKWENYFIYSEIIQTWAKSYLEFKQSFR